MTIQIQPFEVGRDRPGLRSFSEGDRARRGFPKNLFYRRSQRKRRDGCQLTPNFQAGFAFAFDGGIPTALRDLLFKTMQRRRENGRPSGDECYSLGVPSLPALQTEG